MKRIRCLVSMPSDEQRAAAVAVRDSVTARQQQQQVDSKRLKELEDTARGVYNRFEPPLPALRSKGMTVEELKHLSQKLGVGSVALNMQRIGESRWRPQELCSWPDQGALPAKGKEYPGLGYKRVRDKPPKAQEQQQQPAEAQ
ncbi:hypothetical protein QJQ45_009504 [Haematococcus lacustris]|nr:hypothetical protein QJQ45_005474 [Haematococcus lacustris]KAJ9526055.1 hypothetical protein QJQ45_009504 [Haematococcus lacustris]